ncbi:MAG: hypothetical protein HOQ05_09730 [Corynebacteriales bacterium]|nr:hypothetical protein [Mycobacteriales bacterium]
MFEQTVIVLVIVLILALSSAGIATIWLGRTRALQSGATPKRPQVTWVLVTLMALSCASITAAGLVVALSPPMGPVRYVGAGVIAVLFFSLIGASLTFLADIVESRQRNPSKPDVTDDSWDLDNFAILDFREKNPTPTETANATSAPH